MAATATPVQTNPVAFRIIAYENERKMSMEDILQDPKSTWEEMRSVMRSQGHASYQANHKNSVKCIFETLHPTTRSNTRTLGSVVN